MTAPASGRAPSWRPTWWRCSTVALAGVAFALAGCGDGDSANAPHLERALIVQPGGAVTVDLLASAGGGVPAISPLSQLWLAFDQPLDATKIETVNGTTTTGMTNVVTLAWVNPPAGAPAIGAVANFNPSAMALGMMAPMILVRAQPSLPSSATVQFMVNRPKVVNKSGQAYVGPASGSFQTGPFQVSAGISAGASVPANVRIGLAFTNIPAVNVGQLVTVTGAVNGPLPVAATPDPAGPNLLLIGPLSGPWPSGDTYHLQVDPSTKDVFGTRLTSGLDVSFTVGPPNPDAGPPSVDAGVDAETGGPDAPIAADMAVATDTAPPVDAPVVIDAPEPDLAPPVDAAVEVAPQSVDASMDDAAVPASLGTDAGTD